MIRFSHLAAGTVTILAGVICLTLQANATDDDKEKAKANADAQAAVLKMTDKLGNADLAKQIAGDKGFGSDNVMRQFKPRSKGGLGVGAAPPAAPIKDSIELLIIDLAQDKKGFTKDAVTKLGPDLAKVAKQTQAIAEINAFYAPTVKKGDKDPAVWKKLNDDMKAGAADLAKATTPAEAKTAAGKLNTSCVKCHEIFRVD